MDETRPRRRGWQAALEGVVTGGAALAFTAFVLGILLLVLTGNKPGARDFVSYWVAGQRIVHHANPYDAVSILAAGRAVGFPTWANVLIMRNPPWALPLVMSLGFVGLKTASLLWSLALIAVFLVAVHLLSGMSGRAGSRIYLLGYSFGPALACIFAGQTAVFCLLGLVLFLRWHQERPLLAGAALWLCVMKPHLFLPVGAVLLVWVFVTRSYRVIVGLAVMMAVSSALASVLDPAVWGQYRDMMRGSGIEQEFIPCLGVALRFLIHRQAMWIEYLPALVGCVWGVRYYWARRERWDWMTDGALLMLVSLFVTPYAWLSDQALLVPALLVGAYRATRMQIGVLVVASAVIEVMLLTGMTVHSPWFLWTALLWLGWYLYVEKTAAVESTVA